MNAAHMENRIQELRKAKGWSLQDLADRINASKSAIFELEKGKTRLNVGWINRLANVFEVEPEEIYEFTAPQKKSILDDVELLESSIEDLRMTDSQSAYVVLSGILDQIGINSGMIVVVDSDPENISQISTGDVALVAVREKRITRLLLRQFMAPSMLLTNSSAENSPLINLRIQDAGLKGIVTGAYQRFGAKTIGQKRKQTQSS
jgi:transcriptional regulator with XRE-family HTH domain